MDTVSSISLGTLTNRRTKVVLVDENISNYINVDWGVPQGSVLGPSLFLYYTNDMPIGLKSTLFADNTISYMTVSNTPNVETLQAEMENGISPERNIHQSEM